MHGNRIDSSSDNRMFFCVITYSVIGWNIRLFNYNNYRHWGKLTCDLKFTKRSSFPMWPISSHLTMTPTILLFKWVKLKKRKDVWPLLD